MPVGVETVEDDKAFLNGFDMVFVWHDNGLFIPLSGIFLAFFLHCGFFLTVESEAVKEK